jgi:eukaryotic-like serine/threonine-protein kinase
MESGDAMPKTTREIVRGAPAPEAADGGDTDGHKCVRCGAQNPPEHSFCGFCGHDLISSSVGGARRDPLVGAVVGDRYRLLAKIGSGGMGSVYKVEHVRMGKVMALKLLHGDLSRDESMIRRFNREARAVSRLASEHTVQVFDYGQSDGLVYIVMEYLRGRDLGALLGELGPLSVPRCADTIRQVCRSLSEAHSAGVIHRDLKPENVFVCAPRAGKEMVKVLDFGLAKLAEREELAAQTLQGSLIGTPYYMSPEQVSGGDITVASDIYSLGALMYKLVTGDPPYAARTPIAILSAHVNKPVPVLSERLPERRDLAPIDAIIQRAMAKEPGDRFANVDALRRALESVAAGEAMPADLSLSTPGIALEAASTSWFDAGLGDLPVEDVTTRADWDSYESSLRLRRTMSVLASFLLVLAAGGAAYAFFGTDYFARNEVSEEEPNDRPSDATELYSHQRMTGTIGLPAAGRRADEDFFNVRHDGAAGQVLDIHVSAVPGLDLVVEAHDIRGQLVARSNGGRAGTGESLLNLQWRGDELFVSVRELWTQGIPSRSAPGAPYTVTVLARDPEADMEKEPNDRVAAAHPVHSGDVRRGHISASSDRDLYVLPLLAREGRMIRVQLESPPDQDLAVAVVNGAGKQINHFDIVRASAREDVRFFAAPMGPQPLHVAVVAGGDLRQFAKSDTPYRVTIDVAAVSGVTAAPGARK